MKKALAWLLVLVMCLGMFVACSSNGTSNQSTSKTEQGNTVAEPVENLDSAEPVTPAGNGIEDHNGSFYVKMEPPQGAAVRDTVVIGTAYSPTVTDLQAQYSSGTDIVFNMTHNGLVGLDGLTIVAELAESWKQVDDTTWVFTLRKGVKFHNGEELKASDVAFSFNRAKEKGSTASSKLSSVASLETPDEYTVQLNLKAPNMDILMNLAHSTCSILSEKAVTDDPEKGALIGTGPYTVKEFNTGVSVVFERFDDFWDGAVPTKTVEYTYYAENAARVIALQNNEIDVCIGPGQTDWQHIIDDSNLTLIQYKNVGMTYFAFNATDPVVSDKNVRLAVAYALDLEDLLYAYRNGNAIPADTFWGNNTFGRNDEIKAYPYDLTESAKYLKAAGYDNGQLTLDLMVGTAEAKALAPVIQDQLKKAGINVTINEMDNAGFSAATKFDSATHQTLSYSTTWGVNGDSGRLNLHSGLNSNKAIWTNERIDMLLDTAISEKDEAKRITMYQEIQQIVHDECYYIPLYFYYSAMGINNKTGGIIVDCAAAHNFSHIYRLAD